MFTVVLVLHILLVLALIAVILIQRSEGGGLGGIGGGGGMSGFMTGRATANLLTRTTAILAAGFMITSLTLALLTGGGKPKSVIDEIAPKAQPIQTEPASPQPPLPGSETTPKQTPPAETTPPAPPAPPTN